MDTNLVTRLEALGIARAIELVQRHRDESSDALETGPVTDALIETMLDMGSIFQRDHPIKETLGTLVITCLCLGYRIGTEQAADEQ